MLLPEFDIGYSRVEQPESLAKIHEQIEGLGGKPTELLHVLHQAINTAWPYEKVGC